MSPQPLTIRNYRYSDNKGKHLAMMAYWHYVNEIIKEILKPSNGIEGYEISSDPQMGNVYVNLKEDVDDDTRENVATLYATPFDNFDGVERETIGYGLVTYSNDGRGDIFGEYGELAVDWTGNIENDAKLWKEAVEPLLARLLPLNRAEMIS